jgi:hypothetical protein
MNGYWMEIVGKILLLGGFLIALVSQLCIIALAFKTRYYEGLSCLAAPMYALVSSDFRKDNNVRFFITLWGVSLLMVILGAYVLAVM